MNTSDASGKESPQDKDSNAYNPLTQTFSYDCLTTPHELAAKRKEFWGT
jgi:hypothetical protein